MIFGCECHGGVSTIKRRSAMSEIKPCNVKFQLKAIKCEVATSSNIFLLLHRNSALIVLYSYLKFQNLTMRYIIHTVYIIYSMYYITHGRLADCRNIGPLALCQPWSCVPRLIKAPSVQYFCKRPLDLPSVVHTRHQIVHNVHLLYIHWYMYD